MIVPIVLALLLTSPAIASAEMFFDFFWTSQENAFASGPPDPSLALTGRSTATFSERTITNQSGHTFIGGIFRFDGPGTGPFDGLYGGDLEKQPDGSFHAGMSFPSALMDFRDGSGTLTPTDTGFRVSGGVPGSGPDHGAIFSGTMTRRTAQAAEPTSMLLALGALVGAAVLGRRRSTR